MSGPATQQAIEAAEKGKAAALAIFEKAKAEGFFSHFTEYNTELLMPWTMLTSNEDFMGKPDLKEKGLYLFNALVTEIKAALTLSPATPEPSFKLYNVLGFWIGVAESVIFSIFGHGLLSLAWNGGMGYVLAYTLFWTMTCAGNAKYMFYALCLIVLYVLFNVYMGLKTLIFVLPSALYFSKAVCDALMLVNGYVLYKKVIGDGPLIPTDALQLF
jgi:hypothetical protein